MKWCARYLLATLLGCLCAHCESYFVATGESLGRGQAPAAQTFALIGVEGSTGVWLFSELKNIAAKRPEVLVGTGSMLINQPQLKFGIILDGGPSNLPGSSVVLQGGVYAAYFLRNTQMFALGTLRIIYTQMTGPTGNVVVKPAIGFGIGYEFK